MSLSRAAIKASPAPDLWSHINSADENCPTCDQPIPHARFEEIKETIRGRQAEQATHIAARLQEQFSREKAEALEEASRKAAATLAAAVDRRGPRNAWLQTPPRLRNSPTSSARTRKRRRSCRPGSIRQSPQR